MPDQLPEAQRRTLEAAVARIVPGDTSSPGAVDLKCFEEILEGLSLAPARMQLYRAGLAGLDACAHRVIGVSFASLPPDTQDDVLRRAQFGQLDPGDWAGVSPREFFRHLRADVVDSYYSDPRSWLSLGYPGASMPTGYPDGGPCGSGEESA